MPAPAPSATLIRQPMEDVDDAGNRTVYHRGSGIQLTSTVNTKGRLLRATLVLNNEVIAWQHGAQLRTGVMARPSDDPKTAEYDKMPSGMRLERARQAIGAYRGEDKYVKQMGRLLMSVGGFASADVVTHHGMEDSLQKRRRLEAAKKAKQQRLLLIGLGVAFGFALLYALLR